MSSISSARKGRKQYDRNDDLVTISGDFRKIIAEWEETQPSPDLSYGRRIDDEKYELKLDCLSSPYRPDELEPIPMTNLVCEPSQYRRAKFVFIG